MGSLKKSSRRTSKKHQTLYKMKGCSKRSRKNHLGGSSGNINLAYPSNNVKTEPNPFLAYSGKGGSSCSSISSPNLAPSNTNGSNPHLEHCHPSSASPLFHSSAHSTRDFRSFLSSILPSVPRETSWFSNGLC